LDGSDIILRVVRAAVVLLALLAATAAQAQEAEPLLADLSSRQVAITTGFTGANVLLFGEADEQGDVVVVVRGPLENAVVRRKERVLGIWLNRAQATIENVPVYYRVAATRPLEAIAPEEELARHQIGVERLTMPVVSKDTGADAEDYRRALLRLKERARLYSAEPGAVNFLGAHLFRTEIDLPANVPTGTYTVEVYLLRDQGVLSAQVTPLVIGRAGIGAQIFDFATNAAPAYGLAAVLLAAIAGWLGAALFRRR
jgi:uncharacterized protein (TIGR02186 family)